MIDVPEDRILKKLIIPKHAVIDPLKVVAERHKRWRIIKGIAESAKGTTLEINVWDYKNDQEFMDAMAMYCIGMELKVYVKTANYYCMQEALEPIQDYDHLFNQGQIKYI